MGLSKIFTKEEKQFIGLVVGIVAAILFLVQGIILLSPSKAEALPCTALWISGAEAKSTVSSSPSKTPSCPGGTRVYTTQTGPVRSTTVGYVTTWKAWYVSLCVTSY